MQRVRRQDHALAVLQRQGVKVVLGRIERNALPRNNPFSRRLRALVDDTRDALPSHVAEHLDALCDTEASYY